jgi:hypothetical protein
MSDSRFWQTVDTEALLRRRDEATMSANAGAYAQPLGEPMRRKFPVSINGQTHDDVLRKLGDSEHQRALRSMGWVK